MVLLIAFIQWERHREFPLLDVRFFANPRFSAASIAITLVFFSMFGALFFLSQYLQFVLGYDALQSGVRLLPVAFALMIGAPLSSKLVSVFGTKVVVTAGLVLVAVAMLVLSTVSTTSGYPLVAVVLVIVGVGMALAMAPATESIMGSLPLGEGRRRLGGQRHHARGGRSAGRRHPRVHPVERLPDADHQHRDLPTGPEGLTQGRRRHP